MSISHANCDHERTPKGRAACRKQQGHTPTPKRREKPVVPDVTAYVGVGPFADARRALQTTIEDHGYASANVTTLDHELNNRSVKIFDLYDDHFFGKVYGGSEVSYAWDELAAFEIM